MDKKAVIERKKARRLALQALYQWIMANTSPTLIEADFMVKSDLTKLDKIYFKELLYNIAQQKDLLDDLFKDYLDRNLQSLNPIELIILRIGSYELQFRLDIPYRVILNEAVSLAKEFGAKGGHRYVNGILDKVAKSLRPTEKG